MQHDLKTRLTPQGKRARFTPLFHDQIVLIVKSHKSRRSMPILTVIKIIQTLTPCHWLDDEEHITEQMSRSTITSQSLSNFFSKLAEVVERLRTTWVDKCKPPAWLVLLCICHTVCCETANMSMQVDNFHISRGFMNHLHEHAYMGKWVMTEPSAKTRVYGEFWVYARLGSPQTRYLVCLFTTNLQVIYTGSFGAANGKKVQMVQCESLLWFLREHTVPKSILVGARMQIVYSKGGLILNKWSRYNRAFAMWVLRL